MLDLTTNKLQERIKELTALHKTARLLQDDERDSRDVVQEIVDLLPSAWQFPEITAARIQWQSLECQTAGFAPSPWMQQARFSGRQGEQGCIEVVYLAERPLEQEGPFLAEERELIDSLADMLRTFLDHRRAERQVREAYDNLEQLVQSRTSDLQQAKLRLEQEIAEHQRTRTDIERYETRLRMLATELSLAETRQRREFAVELHDHLLQEFAFIKLRVLQFRGDAVFCGFERNLEEIISLLERAIQFTRQLTFQISTPILYELGLAAALEWQGEQVAKRHGIPVQVTCAELPVVLPEAERVTLFKCAQELLTNAVKYSQARQIRVRLQTEDGQLILEVNDNGTGFNPDRLETAGRAEHGFGLFSIRERMRYFGGALDLRSAPGRGTVARLTLPIVPHEQDHDSSRR